MLRLFLWFVLSLVPVFLCSGGSLLVAKHGTRPIRALNTRSHRADVVAELGVPRASVAFSPPVEAQAVMFPPADKASRRDEFEVSGLRMVPSDTIGSASQWNWYPLECATRPPLFSVSPPRLPSMNNLNLALQLFLQMAAILPFCRTIGAQTRSSCF